MDVKTCACCKIEKPITDFCIDRQRKDGHYKYCRSCSSKKYQENKAVVRERQKAYYYANHEKCLEQHRQMRQRNKEYYREYKKKYYSENREKLVRYSTEYCKNHPERTNELKRQSKHRHPETRSESEHRRRARKMKVPFEKIERLQILHRDNFTCCICHKGPLELSEIELDHIVPLSKGGSHTYDNVQTTCCSCNRAKHDKLPY